MRTRTRNALVLLAIAAVAGGGAYFAGGPTRQRAAIEAIPERTFLLVTVDLEKLRVSPMASELGGFREVSDVSSLCGFDPLSRAKELVIAVPEEETGEFGLAVTHDLTRDEVAACARKIADANGDGSTLRQEGAYAILEPKEAIDPGPKGQIVYREGAPLLIGRGAWMTKMRGALDGTEPRVSAQKAHTALREVAGASSAPALRPTLIATAVLPKTLRERLRRQMVTEAEGAKGAATMDAILAVGEVAIAVRTTTTDAPVQVFAELRCEKAGACDTVRGFVDRKRNAFAADPLVKLMGFGSMLDAIKLEVNGEILDANVEWSAADVKRAFGAIQRAAFPSAPPPPKTFADEVVKPQATRDR
ncbi:hypothetical protein BH09MYX1_BH09MYX1_58660 [soil metagenome]